jgi:uncharacterized protein (DUF58 family)
MPSEVLLSERDLELLRFQAQQLNRLRASATSPVSGAQISRQRGAGLELEDLRPYQFGDDVRHIAWRATARSGRPISKVFRAERRQRILLLVEQHPGMAFATRGELKATVACRAVALLGFAAQRQGAEVGAVVINDETHFFTPGPRLEQTLRLIGSVNRMPIRQTNTETPRATLEKLQRLAQRDDAIYFISDFHHWDESLLPLLQQLSEHHTLHALQIIDAGEQQLSAVGKLRIRSPFDGSEVIIDTDNEQLRQQYAAAMQAKQAQLEQLFIRSGVQHLRLYTDAELLTPIAQAL